MAAFGAKISIENLSSVEVIAHCSLWEKYFEQK